MTTPVAGPAPDPLRYTSGSIIDADNRLHPYLGMLPAGSREVPNDQRTTEFYNLKTDPSKVSEEELRSKIFYNAALADIELKKAKDQADDKTQERCKPMVGTNPVLASPSAPDPQIFRVKHINLPTYGGDTSVASINDFSTAMKGGVREASTQSLGIEVLLDTKVWSNVAIMQLRNSIKETYPGAFQWANKWTPGVHTTHLHGTNLSRS
ncbi:hypothetical protein FN846DRAFT_896695 [Sphaerosporella brunnea]|uniref:Uncharacterized protein n=1 Tax=Sphaerosporella brunnea TaxID=1250544 RepID=A0A5J5EAZ5_9PEZI|nr:hypothetical protein FN846DRAFT_896695 [Sphaerosporella brunnea]